MSFVRARSRKAPRGRGFGTPSSVTCADNVSGCPAFPVRVHVPKEEFIGPVGILLPTFKSGIYALPLRIGGLSAGRLASQKRDRHQQQQNTKTAFLHRGPLYNGLLKATGSRYCPPLP